MTDSIHSSVGKTIASYDESPDGERLILIFTDGSQLDICANAGDYIDWVNLDVHFYQKEA